MLAGHGGIMLGDTNINYWASVGYISWPIYWHIRQWATTLEQLHYIVSS